MDRHKKQDIQAAAYFFGSYFVHYLILCNAWKVGDSPQNYQNWYTFWWLFSPLTVWVTMAVYVLERVSRDILPFLARLLW